VLTGWQLELMVKVMKIKNRYQKTLLVYFLLVLAYWVGLHLHGSKTSNYNYFYSFLFSLTPLLGGLVGMWRSSIWGRFKSAMGKAMFFFALGLFLWGAGSMIWSWYNFFPKVAAPYPSLADIGFAPSIFFCGLGAFFLSKATGARFALKNSLIARFFAVLAPIIAIVASYYLLVKVARGGVIVPPGETTLKAILDIAYPLGDLTALILSVLIYGLSFRYFGGLFRLSITCLLVGLGVMYAGDFVFSYTTTTGSFYNGDWGDLILTTGLFLLTFGVLGFASKPQLGSKPAKSGVEA
jgi:hypothetical protein